MYSIEGYMGGDLVFRRNTPSRRGVETLINEGLSALMAADAASRDYIEVLQFFQDDPENPEVLSITFVSDGYDEVIEPEDSDWDSVTEEILQRDAETEMESKVFRSPLDDLSDEIL